MGIDNQEWTSTSVSLLKRPFDLSLYEDLIEIAENNNKKGISKSSTVNEIDLLRISYDNILEKFPLLVNYWIRLADWELKLGDTTAAEKIYIRAFQYLPFSIELWVSFLKFKINTVTDDLDQILSYFENARIKIGTHFYAYEYYKLYLDFLRNYSKNEKTYEKKYYILLRTIIEIPLYHYDYFYNIFFKAIAEDSKILEKIVPKNEVQSFIDKDNKAISLSLRKIFTDVYITTQYKVYQIFEFEKDLPTHYFDNKLISSKELATWESYLSFVELNYPAYVSISLYERCLSYHANISSLWIRYVDFFIMLDKYVAAEEVLKRAIHLNSDCALYIKLADIYLFNSKYLSARDLISAYLHLNISIPIPIYEKLLNIESILSNNDDEYMMNLFSEIINQTNNDWFFKVLLKYPLKKDSKIKLFERFSYLSGSSIYTQEFKKQINVENKVNEVNYKRKFDNMIEDAVSHAKMAIKESN